MQANEAQQWNLINLIMLCMWMKLGMNFGFSYHSNGALDSLLNFWWAGFCITKPVSSLENIQDRAAHE